MSGAGSLPLISVVTPCFNEEGNVEPLYERIRAVFAALPAYRYEHLFIDNASTDRTVERIKRLAAADPNVKLIVNCRNYGHIRSPLHAFFQAGGDAVIVMVSDLQDPPELIPEFIARWEAGFKVVIGVKAETEERWPMSALRRLYYRTLNRLSDTPLIDNFTGFGLYDREVVDTVRRTEDNYPYFRGLIADLGYARAEIPYRYGQRGSGITKNNFLSLYDTAILGITSHSKLPLRIATLAGFALSLLSLLISLGYLIAKIAFWDSFAFGMAPILIGVFFFSSVQLFFIGLVGEYILAIHGQVLKRPLVIEKERINFAADTPPPGPSQPSG
jgi:glycosyltransferase involved in cell wall biosynthesis